MKIRQRLSGADFFFRFRMRCYLIIQMYMIQIFATRRVTDPTLLEGPGEIISPSFSFYGR